ncbi:MAG: glycosyltransferase family 4 protein [Flavobacteriaceae bacterium]|nr:glycosyltransferase family 4 protein [Flavobacteriaceae bacterium]
MRIGMILDKTYPPDPRVQNEAITLLKNGHEVFLFCLQYGGQDAYEKSEGLEIFRYRSNRFIYKSSALAYTIPVYTHIMAKKIRDFIKRSRIEAIHVHDMVVAGAAFAANKNFSLPIVLDLHENRPEIMKEYPHLKKVPNKYLISPDQWKKAEGEFIKKSYKTIVVTQEAKIEILKRNLAGDGQIVVVPNTVLSSFYEDYSVDQNLLNRYKEKFVILYIGDTGLRRGLMTAIKALPELRSKIKNIRLVIVGTSSADEILQNKVRDLGLNDVVDFEGWKDALLFQSYILASAVCISPLLKNLHHDTTYANKIFQYMALAKPLLVSDVTAQKNIVQEAGCGLVHEAGNAENFVKNILTLYHDPKEMENLGEQGRKFIRQKFNWEITGKALVKLYNDLAAIET